MSKNDMSHVIFDIPGMVRWVIPGGWVGVVLGPFFSVHVKIAPFSRLNGNGNITWVSRMDPKWVHPETSILDMLVNFDDPKLTIDDQFR